MTDNTAKRIGEFELIDHGIGHSQYFQGCGVAFTGFANVVTGIGDNPAEAIDDCLEQMAMSGFDSDLVCFPQNSSTSLRLSPGQPTCSSDSPTSCGRPTEEGVSRTVWSPSRTFPRQG